MKIDDRRKFHRIDFDGMVNLEFNDTSYHCCPVKNLSLTGMFVVGNFNLRQGKNCFVKIFHEEKSGNNCLLAIGEVVWNNDDGIGLRFTSMTFENYMLLMTTLRNKADQPGIVLSNFPISYPYEVLRM